MTESPPEDHSEALEVLVFDTLERMEKEGSAAIESAVSDHPELEQELRERLGALQSMGLIGSEGDRPISVPTRLGSYELSERIGEGGMGLVYLARDTVLDREVAIKLIRPELVASASLRERFTRESRAVARLQHPAVGRIFDAGETAGFPFMAMEYIHGCTLARVLDALDGRAPERLTGRDLQSCVEALSGNGGGEPLGDTVPTDSLRSVLFGGTWSEACIRIGLAVAEGLSSAHASGVLHRDIKASNVMITPGGRVVLIDFGLAQLDSAAKLTTTGGRVGSLPYIPPERFVGGASAAESADLYGLGVLLYELLTLRLPFRASSESALVKLIARSQPEPLRSINPAVPPLIRDAAERAMRRDPARRPPSAADYAVDLSRVLAGKPPLPHGDGPIAVLLSQWRAQPVITAALAACTLLLLFLPAALLSVKAKAAERSAQSKHQSFARLGLALRAADDLQHSLPITDVIEGTPVGQLRTDVLEELVELRAAIGVGVDSAGRPMESVRDDTASSKDRAAILAAHFVLGLKSIEPSSEALRRDAAESLKEMLPHTSHLIDAKTMLAQLLHSLAVLELSSGDTQASRSFLEEALSLLRELRVVLPESERLASLESEWSTLLDSILLPGSTTEPAEVGDAR